MAIIRAEYSESLDLSLTRSEVEQLWELPAEVCNAVLNQLVESGFLQQTIEGYYRRPPSAGRTD
jgi:hypothetical protein